MTDVTTYYNEIYEENNRLSSDCDNRHRCEKLVKQAIIESYITLPCSLLEIGAGTGVHSIYFAKKGCEVTACDLVEKHVQQMEENAKAQGVHLNASVQNALNLSYEDHCFDIVLLSGPVYHLSDPKDKEQAIAEAKRVCKKGGILVVDFLPRVHSFIQQILRYPDFIDGLSEEDIEALNCKDDTFSFDTKKDMELLAEQEHLKILSMVSTDGITRFIQQDINKLTHEQLTKWIHFIQVSNDYDCVDLGEHALMICMVPVD